MYDLAVKNGSVYIQGEFRKRNLYISEGIFQELTDRDIAAKETIDADGKKISPGIIDPHVHFALKVGNYTSADDFESGSIAGIYGGVTSYIDFLDPVHKASDIPSALEKREALSSKSFSDYSFHVAAANPKGETEGIGQKALELDLPSIKIFTAYSDSNRRTYEKEIRELLKLTVNSSLVLLVHAEDEEYITLSNSFSASDLPVSRPVQSEISMLRKLASLVSDIPGTLYMVHTTCGESVEILAHEFSSIWNKNMFLESCPQYFYLNDSLYQESEGFKYILAPPLRPEKQRNILLKNFNNIFSLGTDHCPFTFQEKSLNLLQKVPFGLGGIEHSFSLMYSIYGDEVINKMTINPAKIFGLYPRKGLIAEGADADFFVFSQKSHKISENHSRCDYDPYEGTEVLPQIETTVIRGSIVLQNGRILPHRGTRITRNK